MVLVSHQFAITGRPEPLPIGPHSFGSLGVLIFFAISGYLVASSWERDPSPFRFAARRFLRIWPGLAVCVLLLSFLVTLSSSDDTTRYSALRYLGNLFFTGYDWSFFSSNPHKLLNGPLWTIRYEVLCYLLFAIVALIFGKKLQVCVIPLVLTIIGTFFFFGGQQAIEKIQGWLFLPFFGSFFGMGVILQIYPMIRRYWWVMVAIGCLFIIFDQPSVGLLFLLPSLVIHIGVQSWPIFRKIELWGDLSYGIYLYAWPIQQFGFLIFSSLLSFLSLLTISLAASTTAALLSWNFIEKPALKFKPNKIAFRS